MDVNVVDSTIVALNNLPKEFLSGQYINACGIVSAIAKNLIAIREYIEAQNKKEKETGGASCE